MNLFPHKKVRKGQKEFMAHIEECVNEKKHLIANAPTGIGKTAAVLTKTLEYALKNDKKVFFLTPRNSQHKIVIDTAKKMDGIKTVDIIGKKHMCPKDTANLGSGSFTDLCRKLKEDNLCKNYRKNKQGKKLSPLAQKKIDEIKQIPLHAEQIKEKCSEICPYEITLALVRDANLVICDYYHLFASPRETILSRGDVNLEDIIIVIDEAHNFPSRIRKLLSQKLTDFSLNNGIKEAEEFDYQMIKEDLNEIRKILKELWEGEDRFVHKHEFIDKVPDYEALIADLDEASSIVLEESETSHFSSIQKFLEAWKGDDKGFARIIKRDNTKKGKKYHSLCYNSLDASIITKPILKDCHCTVLMSGTLKPMKMYEDLLGIKQKEAICREYESSFPSKNRLDLLIPDVTTKYTERSKKQYKRIAERIEQCTDSIPGNVACFFPSYRLRDDVLTHLSTNKIVFREESFMDKQEKNQLLKDFIESKNGLLTGAQAGSLAEGIDYPGVHLNGVIIVGISLKKPTLEVKALIDYYERKFGKGWDYAYSFPAIQRAIQSSGRAIRSKTDIGIAVFMDKRFAWNNYRKIFPETIQMVPTITPERNIKKFLSQHN